MSPLTVVATLPDHAFGRQGAVGPMMASSPALQKLFVPTAPGKVGGILDSSSVAIQDMMVLA